jgi:hypothetical protein
MSEVLNGLSPWPLKRNRAEAIQEHLEEVKYEFSGDQKKDRFY